ncbi:hypothetical protein ACS0TY_034198 [Phlomoides rotata]
MITLRRLHLRLALQPPPYTLHHFSSDVPPGKSESEPSLSSYFNEVRANLKREAPPQNLPRKPLSFSKSPQIPPPPKGSYLEEIDRNLAEYRSRSAPPPPSLTPGQSDITKDNESAASSATNSPSGRSFDAIRESLRHWRPESKNGSDQYLSTSRDPKPVQNDGLPSFFWKEKNAGEDGKMRTGFMSMYNYSEMGAKLKTLRPEKKKGKWFSLHELNERLVKLREMEEKESRSIVSGISFKDLRDTVVKLANSEEERTRKKTMQRLDILGQLGGTPTYLMLEPKDDLVEKYFHPDNMSSSEKLKLELKRVRDEFKMSESDCGSARVQVALLTTKIHHLSSVLHKKDKHSRRGLLAMVQRRKKLLKYLRRSDWDSYCLVLSKLSLRDVTDIKS